MQASNSKHLRDHGLDGNQMMSGNRSQVGVVYLLTHPQHAARLIVSIYSLRRFFDGPVTIFSTRSATRQLTDRMASDDRLRVEIRTMEEADGPNATYVTKPRMVPLSPYEATLFLDADTLVVGDISELIEAIETHPLVVTGFCDWTTQHGAMRVRFDNWLPLCDQPGDKFQLRRCLDAAMQQELPVINAGVYGFQRNCPSLDQWIEFTDFACDHVLPDEMSLQLMLQTVEHKLLDTRFNYAPAFMQNPIADVRIYHFAATSHSTHQESSELWFEAYQQCRDQQIADIGRWSLILPIESRTAELKSWIWFGEPRTSPG